jgi:negative regulator of sigma E activity
VVCSTGVCLLAPASVENTAAGRGGSATPSNAAVGVRAQRPLGPVERRALELLRRAGLAESHVGYQGMKVFHSWSMWGHVTTAAFVRNVPGKGITVQASAATANQAIAVDNVLDLGDATLTTLADTYRLRAVAAGELLSRPVTRVDVARPSGAVVGQFWLDDASGLALQRVLLSSAGDVVRRTAFTSVKILAPAASPMIAVSPSPTSSATGSTATTDPCDDGLAAADLDRLRAEGWDLPTQLPGGLSQVCARQVGSGVEKSVQLSYSDGLFALSLFVQHGRLAAPAGFSRHQISGSTVYLQCGLYRELTWGAHGMVYTVVTDLPDATVADVIAAVPSTSNDAGVLDRMSRGIRRVGSWIDPFS